MTTSATFAPLRRYSVDRSINATAENVRCFHIHQRGHGSSKSVIGAKVSALRSLFSVTLNRPNLSRKLMLAPCPREDARRAERR